MTNQTSLPLPQGFSWVAVGANEIGVVHTGAQYVAHAKHVGGEQDWIYVTLSPEAKSPLPPAAYMAFTWEQWAAIFAVVASVAPGPVWSRVEEMKR